MAIAFPNYFIDFHWAHSASACIACLCQSNGQTIVHLLRNIPDDLSSCIIFKTWTTWFHVKVSPFAENITLCGRIAFTMQKSDHIRYPLLTIFKGNSFYPLQPFIGALTSAGLKFTVKCMKKASVRLIQTENRWKTIWIMFIFSILLNASRIFLKPCISSVF